MRNIKLTIEYDGTSYHGWQKQNDVKTVQGELIKALSKLTGETIELIGSSRTDVGVHAYGQCANFLTKSSMPGDRISIAVNNRLPRDIVVKESEEVPLNFHARFYSKEKTYKYLIYNEFMPSALLRNYTCHIKKDLDIDIMNEAAKYLLGKKDFASFRPTDCNAYTSIRTIKTVRLVYENGLIAFYITGDGFLYKMVRTIIGTLITVGLGKMTGEQFRDVIELKDRSKAGRTAPGKGLYLMEVKYSI